MSNILSDWIDNWLKEGLIEAIMGNFEGMFQSINVRVGEIAAEVGTTPEAWNSDVFSMIKDLSDTVIVPVAGIILTFVLCYELIQLIIEKNNMHDFDVFNIYKWLFKTFCAVYILTHTFDIVMSVFSIAQSVIVSSSDVIGSGLDVSSGATLAELEDMLQAMSAFELIGVWLESFIVSVCLTVMSIFIFIIIYGRMIEIYLSVSMAPIPFSTMANREWGQIGNNYLKSLIALAFQGFLIIVCVAIYAALVQGIPSADSVHGAIWGTVGYTVLLCFSLLKTSSLAKSIFSAH